MGLIEVDYGLRNRKVIITGASRGLGQACAATFAAHGAELLLAARSRERLEQVRSSIADPPRHRIFAGDLNQVDTIAELVECAGRFGEIDVVLHVMGGGLGMREPLLSWEDFQVLFQTNIASAAEINKSIIPGMVERGVGNIVHVGSISGREATGSVGYNSVKAALAAYVRTLGRELAATGVVVTGISPGGFWAPENSWARFKERDPELFEEVITQRQPRKKLGEVEEMMPMMLFLASRHATMMTGCCVPIDGGEGLGYL